MAIRIAFSFGVVSEDRKSAALAFCNHIKDSDDGWRHALQRLHTAGLSGPQEVKFFCLDILRHTLLTGRYNRMLEQDRAGLRNSLLLFVRDVVPRVVQEPMIKNVLCLVLTLLVQQDFPERWPSFFTDFASLLSQSPEILDVYFRMLSTIQQEIVEFDRSQTSEEAAKHNIFIKDTIREKCFPSILNTIQQVMQSLHASHPTLVVSALQVLKQYTSWVDITLVVSPQMLTPLCQLLFQEVYQVTAAECLLEILYKRMGPIKKLTLLKEIRVFPLLVEVLNACATASACFVKKVAAVVNCLGVQLVEILKALRALDFAPASAPPRLIADDWDSSTWPPNVNPADVFSEASAMLDHALQLSFHLLETRGATDFKVSDELHDFVSHYILLIKPDTEGKNELAPGPLANFQRILRIIVQQLAYPERYDLENKFEIEEEFDSYHKDLCKVLHHQLQMCPWAVVEVTLAQLQLLAQHGDNTPVSWARLEATLFLAYSCGHNLSGRIHTSITVEPYRSMLGYAFSVSLGRTPHSLLMLTYFQLCTRWAPYLEAHTQYFLPVILTCLDSRGLHHSSPSVRSAASHCFIRLLKELANKCKHLIIANFDAIATKIESVVTSTLTQGLSGKSSRVTQDQESEAIALCEALGILASSAVTDAKCGELATLVSTPLTRPLELSLQQLDLHNDAQRLRAGHCWGLMVDCLGSFSGPLCAHDQKAVHGLFIGVFEKVVRAFLAIPSHESLRKKTISFIHQMIVMLPTHTLEVMSTVTATLVHHCDSNDVGSVLALAAQLALAFKENAMPYFNQFLFVIVQKAFSCMESVVPKVQTPGADAAYSQDLQALLHIQKSYFLFLKAVVSSNLCASLHCDINLPHRGAILESLLNGTVTQDPTVLRTILAVLKQIIQHWFTELGPSRALNDVNLCRLALHQLTERCFQFCLTPRFDLADANTNLVLRDLAALQIALASLFREAFTHVLQSFLSISLRCPPTLIEQYVAFVSQPSQSGQFKQFLQEFIRKMRN